MFVGFISIQLLDELIFDFGELKLALKHISNTVYSLFIIIPYSTQQFDPPTSGVVNNILRESLMIIKNNKHRISPHTIIKHTSLFFRRSS